MGIVSFFQNMAFTWTSRSRNSGNPSYHRYASILSNGIWFLCSLFIWKQVWPILQKPINDFNLIDISRLIITVLIYILSTTEGSVLMMKILLKKETGDKKVGYSKN